MIVVTSQNLGRTEEKQLTDQVRFNGARVSTAYCLVGVMGAELGSLRSFLYTKQPSNTAQNLAP